MDHSHHKGSPSGCFTSSFSYENLEDAWSLKQKSSKACTGSYCNNFNMCMENGTRCRISESDQFFNAQNLIACVIHLELNQRESKLSSVECSFFKAFLIIMRCLEESAFH